jgi:transposase
MSPTAIPYVGVDVSVQWLQCDGPDGSQEVRNAPEAVRVYLTKLRQAHPAVHVVCEASGGCERLLVRTAQMLHIPVSCVNPRRVRDFARGLGWLEKTDAIDAAVLRRFGETAAPAAQTAADPVVERLREQVQVRAHYVAQLQLEETYLATLEDKALRKLATTHCRRLAALIARLELQMDALLDSAPELSARVQTLCLVQSVSVRAAAAIVAHLPELGQLSDGAISKLAGLAPFADDSGQHHGPRHIRHGRREVRRVLYLCALVAARFNDHLRPIYTRLRAAGKPAKVALIALARKLLIYLNHLLKPALLKPV